MMQLASELYETAPKSRSQDRYCGLIGTGIPPPSCYWRSSSSHDRPPLVCLDDVRNPGMCGLTDLIADDNRYPSVHWIVPIIGSGIFGAG